MGTWGVSLYHQGNNIDRARLRQPTGQPELAVPQAPRRALHELGKLDGL